MYQTKIITLSLNPLNTLFHSILKYQISHKYIYTHISNKSHIFANSICYKQNVTKRHIYYSYAIYMSKEVIKTKGIINVILKQQKQEKKQQSDYYNLQISNIHWAVDTWS